MAGGSEENVPQKSPCCQMIGYLRSGWSSVVYERESKETRAKLENECDEAKDWERERALGTLEGVSSCLLWEVEESSTPIDKKP